MAEIKIEKKKAIWPWVLLGLLVLGFIWYFFLRNPDNRVVEDNRSEQVLIEDNEFPTKSSALDLYSAYIGDTSKMGNDHEYSHGALTHLIDAVEEKGNKFDVDLNANLDQARKDASEITKDPSKLNHADLIKNSGKIITRALTTLQKAKFPDLMQDLAKVDAAVSAIDTSDKILDQRDVVNNFFKSAESILLKMQ